MNSHRGRPSTYIYTYGIGWKYPFYPTYPRRLKLQYPQGSVFWTTSKMRKTKLIILPTKCLNTMGFLLLYLSCPVIADWGRNKPDTEMSQWSIFLDKEGSCGLIRNSREDEPVTDGLTEYQAVGGGVPRNDTPLTTGYSTNTDKGNSQAYCRIQRKSERRIARRETRERRTISLDRRNSIRRVGNLNRNYKNTPQERRNDARRLSSLDRRVRSTNKVIRDNVRIRQRRENESLRMENGAGSRRVEERRLSRRIDNDDAATRRVSSEVRRSSRVRNTAERRERRAERRLLTPGRSSSEREMTQTRRQDNPEERRSSPRRVETRRGMLKDRVSDERRTARGITVRREQSEPGMRRNPATPGARRTERSPERREASQRREVRRLAVDISRRQDSRGRESRKREGHAREKMQRIDRYGRMEPRISKLRQMERAGESKWELLDGIKNWFRQKTDHESWVVNDDFATTCLVGASVYLLTARQIKSV